MHDDDLTFEKFQKRWPSAMPAASQQAKKSARKRTYRSEAAKKKIGKTINGLHRRRRRKLDD